MKHIKLLHTIFICFIFSNCFCQESSKINITAVFDKMLNAHFPPGDPGATVLISKKGEIIYKKAFGMANVELKVPMKEESVFWLASIGKQFTAIAILQLLEQGKLNLDDEITKFIPDYPNQGHKITIEHLLTHTSGIHNFSGMKDPEKKLVLDCTPEEVIDFFKNLPMKFKPGTQWEYSNSGYFLLGYIIEIISGKSYGEYIAENIFKPANMVNSCYANDQNIIENRVDAYNFTDQGFKNSSSRNITHVFSAGALLSTVEDFFKWHQALTSLKLVKKENLQKAFSRYTLTNGSKTDYGYGWRLGNLYDSPTIWHGGLITGFGTMELYLPEEEVFVVVFTNCDCNYPKDLTLRLAAIAAGFPFQYQAIGVDASKQQDYIGLYENAHGIQQVVTLTENQLYIQAGRGPKLKIKSHATDSFFFEEDPMQSVAFQRNNEGQITALKIKRITGSEVFLKTSKPLPNEDGMVVAQEILNLYVGKYEIPTAFSFTVEKENGKLFILAQGQEKFELFAETESKFFSKVDDAQFEFVKNNLGAIDKVVLHQGGRTAEALKIKD